MNPSDEEIDQLVRELFEAGRPSDSLREKTMADVDEAMLHRRQFILQNESLAREAVKRLNEFEQSPPTFQHRTNPSLSTKKTLAFESNKKSD